MDFSIIIPCYNHGRYLNEALDNLKFSKHYTFEVIIVNDGSTDEETLNVIKLLQTNDNYHIINQSNKGLANARNVGIKQSNGKYILPLDADNKIDLNYLITAKEIFEKNKEVHIVYGKPIFFGNVVESRKWVPIDFNIQKLSIANYIDACAVFRKEVWEKNNGYDENMPFKGVEDWSFWLSAYENGFKFKFINEGLFFYRILDDSMAAGMDSLKVDRSLQYLMSKHYKLYRDLLITCHNDLEILTSIYEKDRKSPLRSFVKYMYLFFRGNDVKKDI